MNVLKIIGCVLFILMLASCSSGSSQRNILAPPTINGFGKTANIVVSTQDPKLQTLIREIQTSLISNLNMRHTFDLASINLDPSDYVLEVEILEGKSVSEGSRILWGGLAGQAKVFLKVSLFEYGAEQPIGMVEVEGKSSGGTVFSGTNEDSVENAVLEIVNWIQGRS